jgi:hypothetical protein
MASDLTEWRTLLEREAGARAALFRGATRPQDRREELRAWWGVVADLLGLYARLSARSIHVEPPPAEALSVLSGLAGYLAVGQIPDPIRDVVGGGRRRPGPTERRDIGLAVAYRLAARPGGLVHNGETIHIRDRTPTKTLAGWFGVKSNTVQGWVRLYAPAQPRVRTMTAELLCSLTIKAGRRYSRDGRSRSAIVKRNAKRFQAG